MSRVAVGRVGSGIIKGTTLNKRLMLIDRFGVLLILLSITLHDPINSML